MNIVDYLTTPGSFVRAPNGDAGCILSFNATTNEVEVTFAAIGPMHSIAQSIGVRNPPRERASAFLQEMRDKLVIRAYHFDQLRVGQDPNEE